MKGEEAGEQQRLRRLHEGPPQHVRLERRVKKGQSLGERRRLFVANRSATRKETAARS